jgi:pimeloyl-ACP methyl ester carboxylesterase
MAHRAIRTHNVYSMTARLSRPEAVLPEDLRFVESTDGVVVAVSDFGGDGPPLLLCHATGLHGHAYMPLIARLRSHFHCVTVDVRAQGMATAPTNANFSWSGVTEDVCAALDALRWSGRGDVRGIGHSQGGYAVISAAVARSGTFTKLFGFEPVIFPPFAEPPPGHSPMSAAARKRRSTFDSPQAAYDNYKGKMPFSPMDDDCLRAYIDWGFEPTADGAITLRCTPAHEAELFDAANTGFFDRLSELTVPTVFGVAEFTNGGFADFVPRQAEAAPYGELMRFPGRTHFGLIEQLDDMAATIISMLGANDGSS